MTGDVDALIVHAPQQEMNFIEDGYASERVPIARNSFVLLGPELYSNSIYDAFSLIFEEEHCFISRGDDSGTHAKEQAIWRHLNETRNYSMVEDSNGYHPQGEWYFSIGQGMGAGINMADEKSCVTLSDRGTALQFQSKIELQRSEFDDAIMENQYSYLIVNSTNTSTSNLFQTFLLSEGKDIIANYTINGDYAFFVD
jgi:tungstate transport system substrate-binding protein